jgi:spore maturation protein B
MEILGISIIPLMLLIIIFLGIIKKVSLFDVFMTGAKDGIKSTIDITPSLVGLITSVSMLKASGALDIFTSAIAPIVSKIGVPAVSVPLMILRPISGSGSLALINNIFKDFGPDSFVGRTISVMMGSTETTFYAIAIYFGSIGIKNTRHTAFAAICADLTGFLMSAFLVRLLF